MNPRVCPRLAGRVTAGRRIPGDHGRDASAGTAVVIAAVPWHGNVLRRHDDGPGCSVVAVVVTPQSSVINAPVVVPILAWRFGAAIQRQIRVRVAWPRRRWVQLHGKETAGGGHFDDLDKVGRVWHLAAGGLLRAGEEHCQYSSNQDGRFQGIFHSCFLSI